MSLSPTNAPARKTSPYKVLANRDYRLLWFGQLVSQIGTQMRLAAIGWQIYVLTHDPLQLGLIGICRIVPLIFFSFIGGPAADAKDRRRLLLVTETILLFFSAVLALVTVTGVVTVWWIYGITIMTSIANAFERPAYSALIPSLVPRTQLGNAMSLNTVNFQISIILGSGLGGTIIAIFGLQGAYIIDAVSYLAVTLALLLIKHRPIVKSGNRVSVKAAFEGIHFVWKQKILVSIMLLDFFATFFGTSRLLLPVITTEVLHSNEVGFGLLSASEFIGGLLCSLVMGWVNVQNLKKPGIVLLVAVFIYSLSIILFGFSNWFPLSMLFLALSGAADTVSMVLRQTIAQLVTPDELRGRMQSINMIFFMGGPQLGEMEAGIVAKAAGAPFSVVSGGIACMLVVLSISYYARQLRDYRFEKNH
ncbi:MAG: MFS transporter [Chloroflexi bacterium]|uniref:MFS transporter n=1 Tax=Candidatus Chlorohelix allophototropha TaxID=3003348 RepID=A0A8T7M564_9CHLR|nr:MFS transporter [Chloroflexota bacterium]WJW69166.1 MFS transporter [Chloroflexota bacterium L227-S17]